MAESYLTLRVTYDDLPDMIEIAAELCHGRWSALAEFYVSPKLLSDAASIVEWSRSPKAPLQYGSGIDGAAGGFILAFRTVDSAQHVGCAIQLVTREVSRESAPRISLEMPTELGLVERFGLECVALGRTLRGEARLIGLPPLHG